MTVTSMDFLRHIEANPKDPISAPIHAYLRIYRKAIIRGFHGTFSQFSDLFSRVIRVMSDTNRETTETVAYCHDQGFKLSDLLALREAIDDVIETEEQLTTLIDRLASFQMDT